jgi:transcriptional regulator with XRE-family HTH domain
LAGITQPEVSNIERGIFNPSDGLLARIAAALGVSPAMELLRPVSEEPVR